MRDSFEYEAKIVDISFYLCTLNHPKQNPQCIEVADWKRVRASALTAYQFPAADEALIRQLREFNFMSFNV